MSDLDYIGRKGVYRGYLVEVAEVARKGDLIIKRLIGWDGKLQAVPRNHVSFVPTTPAEIATQATLTEAGAMTTYLACFLAGILVWPVLTALLRPREPRCVQETRKIIEEAHL